MERAIREGWSRVEVASLVGNLPEILAHAIVDDATRILIIEPPEGERYLQALCAKGDAHLEVSANAFLDEEELDVDEELWLLSSGFAPPRDGCPNWSWDGESIGCSLTAAEMLSAGIFEILGLGARDHVWIRQFEGVST